MNLFPKYWPTEQRNRFLARFLILQWALVGLNIPMLAEPWTNWNWLFIACQLVILACVWPKLRRLEIPLADLLSRVLKQKD